LDAIALIFESRRAPGRRMTVVVTVKINDGIVLASDSAVSFFDANGSPIKIYSHANKVFNLVKGLPIGVMFWGVGGIGSASVATIAKDLRKRLAGDDIGHLVDGI
jgi:hypothetical protein